MSSLCNGGDTAPGYDSGTVLHVWASRTSVGGGNAGILTQAAGDSHESREDYGNGGPPLACTGVLKTHDV